MIFCLDGPGGEGLAWPSRTSSALGRRRAKHRHSRAGNPYAPDIFDALLKIAPELLGIENYKEHLHAAA